ncbi:hypothetical protein B0H34DRAFT_694892 [Crassisporium funariophilum]|nr:hypothetical protein B0H34DRAFT_694892 [Crassisporium funariophilum]
MIRNDFCQRLQDRQGGSGRNDPTTISTPRWMSTSASSSRIFPVTPTNISLQRRDIT